MHTVRGIRNYAAGFYSIIQTRVLKPIPHFPPSQGQVQRAFFHAT